MDSFRSHLNRRAATATEFATALRQDIIAGTLQPAIVEQQVAHQKIRRGISAELNNVYDKFRKLAMTVALHLQAMVAAAEDLCYAQDEGKGPNSILFVRALKSCTKAIELKQQVDREVKGLQSMQESYFAKQARAVSLLRSLEKKRIEAVADCFTKENVFRISEMRNNEYDLQSFVERVQAIDGGSDVEMFSKDPIRKNAEEALQPVLLPQSCRDRLAWLMRLRYAGALSPETPATGFGLEMSNGVTSTVKGLLKTGMLGSVFKRVSAQPSATPGAGMGMNSGGVSQSTHGAHTLTVASSHGSTVTSSKDGEGMSADPWQIFNDPEVVQVTLRRAFIHFSSILISPPQVTALPSQSFAPLLTQPQATGAHPSSASGGLKSLSVSSSKSSSGLGSGAGGASASTSASAASPAPPPPSHFGSGSTAKERRRDRLETEEESEFFKAICQADFETIEKVVGDRPFREFAVRYESFRRRRAFANCLLNELCSHPRRFPNELKEASDQEDAGDVNVAAGSQADPPIAAVSAQGVFPQQHSASRKHSLSQVLRPASHEALAARKQDEADRESFVETSKGVGCNKGVDSGEQQSLCGLSEIVDVSDLVHDESCALDSSEAGLRSSNASSYPSLTQMQTVDVSAELCTERKGDAGSPDEPSSGTRDGDRADYPILQSSVSDAENESGIDSGYDELSLLMKKGRRAGERREIEGSQRERGLQHRLGGLRKKAEGFKEVTLLQLPSRGAFDLLRAVCRVVLDYCDRFNDFWTGRILAFTTPRVNVADLIGNDPQRHPIDASYDVPRGVSAILKASARLPPTNGAGGTGSAASDKKHRVLWRLSRGLYDHTFWNRVAFWQEALLLTISENCQLSILQSIIAESEATGEEKQALLEAAFFKFPFANELSSFGMCMINFGVLRDGALEMFKSIAKRYALSDQVLQTLEEGLSDKQEASSGPLSRPRTKNVTSPAA